MHNTLQSHGLFALAKPLLIFMTSGHSGAQDWAPECQYVRKIKQGGLDQYGAERFGRLIFATIRKKAWEWKG